MTSCGWCEDRATQSVCVEGLWTPACDRHASRFSRKYAAPVSPSIRHDGAHVSTFDESPELDEYEQRLADEHDKYESRIDEGR